MQTENVLRDEDMLILRDISACQRIGKDTIIALATIEGEVPYVRYVDEYYEDGAFYT